MREMRIAATTYRRENCRGEKTALRSEMDSRLRGNDGVGCGLSATADKFSPSEVEGPHHSGDRYLIRTYEASGGRRISSRRSICKTGTGKRGLIVLV